MKEKVRSYIIITFGTLLITFGVYFFEFPNHFSAGGVSGIAIVLGAVFQFISPADLIIIFNVVLLIIGAIVIGKEFGIKTIYASVLMSVALKVLENTCPMTASFTEQTMLELFFDMILVSLGAAMIFNEDGSSGGTDIIAMIIKKYSSIHIGKALLMVDFVVICCAFVIFGAEIGMYSLLAILIRALVIDNAIEGLNASKFFFVVTDKDDVIIRFIMEKLERGATVINDCAGAYTKDEKRMIVTVVGRRQAIMLKHKIKEVDKNAFTIIGTSSDIIGEGFKFL